MINCITTLLLVIAACLLFVRREMGAGKFGYAKKTEFYKWALDIFAIGMCARAYTALLNKNVDIGGLIATISVFIFSIALVYEAWSMEKPPRWWPLK